MCSFISIDGFQIHHVADDVKFIGNAITAVHVTGHSGDLEGLVYVVHLGHGDLSGCEVALVLEPAQAQGQQLDEAQAVVLRAQQDVSAVSGLSSFLNSVEIDGWVAGSERRAKPELRALLIKCLCKQM